MKCSALSFGVASLATAIIFFLVTMSVAFAQTTTQLRPATIDINNVESEQPQTAPDITPAQTLPNNIRGVQKTDIDIRGAETEERTARVQTKNNTTDKPRSFFDKVRSVLQGERQNTSEVESRDKNKEEREAKLKEQKKDRISLFLNNIKRKIDAAISRLEKLGERIESRIVKFEERDVDMSEARRLLGVARGSIGSSIENIGAAIDNAREAFNTSISRNTFGGVVSELTKAKESLRDAHKSFVEIIRIMKANLLDNQSDKQKVNADGTEEVDTTTETSSANEEIN